MHAGDFQAITNNQHLNNRRPGNSRCIDLKILRVNRTYHKSLHDKHVESRRPRAILVLPPDGMDSANVKLHTILRSKSWFFASWGLELGARRTRTSQDSYPCRLVVNAEAHSDSISPIRFKTECWFLPKALGRKCANVPI
jgi:hypothetical protein